MMKAYITPPQPQNDVAVEPVDGDSMERSRLFARVLAWSAGLPQDTFESLVTELSYEVPLSSRGLRKKKKVRVSTSLQMSEV